MPFDLARTRNRCQQVPRRVSQQRVHPLRIDFRQRRQNESPQVHPGVGEEKAE